MFLNIPLGVFSFFNNSQGFLNSPLLVAYYFITSNAIFIILYMIKREFFNDGILILHSKKYDECLECIEEHKNISNELETKDFKIDELSSEIVSLSKSKENSIIELTESIESLNNTIEELEFKLNQSSKLEEGLTSQITDINIKNKKSIQKQVDFFQRKYNELKIDFTEGCLRTDLINCLYEKLISKKELSHEEKTTLVNMFLEVEKNLKDSGQPNLGVLTSISTDVNRLDQIEAMFDLYSSKIQAVKDDSSLDEEDRDIKLQHWERLRDRDITRLEE